MTNHESKCQKDLEKLKKQLEKEIEKSKQPVECLKLVNVLIDFKNETMIMHNFVNSLKELIGPTYEILDANISENVTKFPVSIQWSKKELCLNFKNGSWIIETKNQIQSKIVLVLLGDKFMNLLNGIDDIDGINSIFDLIQRVRSDQKLFLIVLNFDYEMMKLRNNHKKNCGKLSPEEIEDLILDLEYDYKVTIWMMKDIKEAARLCRCYTKSIAEEDYKKKQISRSSALFDFSSNAGAPGKLITSNGETDLCLKSSNCRIISDIELSSNVAKARNNCVSLGGVDELWRIQLSHFRGVTSDIADAVRSKYHTPNAAFYELMQITEELGEEVAIKEISEIEIRRSTEYLSNTRRVGKEIASRIYRFLTSQFRGITVQ